MNEAFITGSHAYGTPTAESDVDLVVYCSPETRLRLIELSDDKAVPVRFGNLNLILPGEKFDGWKAVTDAICTISRVACRPIGHDEAKLLFRASGIGCYTAKEGLPSTTTVTENCEPPV